MKIRDMGMRQEEPKTKETISGVQPVERFPMDNSIKTKKQNWMMPNYKTKPIHNSNKCVMHTRNHTHEGIDRHQ